MYKRVTAISVSTILVVVLLYGCITQYLGLAFYIGFMSLRPATTPLPDLDKQFSQQRRVITSTEKESNLFPAKINGFVRSVEPINDGWYNYFTPQGGQIRVSIRRQFGRGPYLDTSGRSCGDYMV